MLDILVGYLVLSSPLEWLAFHVNKNGFKQVTLSLGEGIMG